MKIIFITGHRKSGTTLTLSLFDNHPDIATFPFDLTFLYSFFPFYENKSQIIQKKRLKEIINKKLNTKNFNKYFKWNKKKKDDFIFQFLKKINRRNKINKVNLTILFIKYWIEFNSINKKIIAIKETSQIQFYQTFLSKIPNCKIINIIRDPRDNFAALKSGYDSYYKKIGEDYLTLINSFLYRLKTETKFFLKYNKSKKNKILFLKYEDLILNNSKSLNKISKFLNIANSKTLRTPSLNGISLSGNSFDGKNKFKLSSRNINNWNRRLNSFEKAIINFYLSDEIKFLKYKSFLLQNASLKYLELFYELSNYKFFYKDSTKTSIQKN